MAIREKLRKTFGKKNKGSSSGGSTPSTSSDPNHYTGRTDIEYYKPHEIPKSKYKGKVDPEHKDKLDAYSFADAFNTVRRKTSQALSGVMSPGGTKSQSRRPSYTSHISKISRDNRRKSIATTTGPNDDANPVIGQSTHTGAPAPLIRENSDDDTDVQNAGLSRAGMADTDDPKPVANVPEVKLERQATVGDHPFTAAELEQAMTRATIRGNDEGPLRSRMAVAAH